MLTERACSRHVSLEVLKDNNSLGDHLGSPLWWMRLNDAVFDLWNKEGVFEKIIPKRKKAIGAHVQSGISSKADQSFGNVWLRFFWSWLHCQYIQVYLCYMNCSCILVFLYGRSADLCIGWKNNSAWYSVKGGKWQDYRDQRSNQSPAVRVESSESGSGGPKLGIALRL